MRIAAAGLAAIVAALALDFVRPASADQTNPFPSPSPATTPAPGDAGFVILGYSSSSASGGQVVAAPTSTPMPFPNTSAGGFSLELLGKLSTQYVAALRFDDENLRGSAASVETRFDIAAMYRFLPSHVAAGLGFVSLAHSTLLSSANGPGAGIALLPDFARRVSPYGSFFFYPNLNAPGAARGGLSIFHLGLTFAPAPASGPFLRVGVVEQHFGASGFAPATLGGAEIGLGASF